MSKSNTLKINLDGEVHTLNIGVDETILEAALEKDIDYLQALKIHESILKNKLGRVLKAKKVVKSRIKKKV